MENNQDDLSQIRKNLDDFFLKYNDRLIDNLITPDNLESEIIVPTDILINHLVDPSVLNTDITITKIGDLEGEKFKCIHCELIGKGRRFYRKHFSDCLIKDIGKKKLDEALKSSQSLEFTSRQFKLPKHYLRLYNDYHKIIFPKGKTCSHCTLELSPREVQFHFNNCVLKGVNLETFVSDLQNISRERVRSKYNLQIGRYKKYLKHFSIIKAHQKGKKCPHCEVKITPYNGNFHFEKCPFRDIDLKGLIEDFSTYNDYKLSLKYGISIRRIESLRKDYQSRINK